MPKAIRFRVIHSSANITPLRIESSVWTCILPTMKRKQQLTMTLPILSRNALRFSCVGLGVGVLKLHFSGSEVELTTLTPTSRFCAQVTKVIAYSMHFVSRALMGEHCSNRSNSGGQSLNVCSAKFAEALGQTTQGFKLGLCCLSLTQRWYDDPLGVQISFCSHAVFSFFLLSKWLLQNTLSGFRLAHYCFQLEHLLCWRYWFIVPSSAH